MLVADIGKLRKIAAQLKSSGAFAFDTETIPDKSVINETEILVISLANDAGSWVVPCGVYAHRGEAGKELQAREVMDVLKDVFEDKNVVKVMHNCKFDRHAVKNYGIEVVNMWDTMVAGWLLDENTLKSLKVRAAEVGMFLHEFKEAWKQPVSDFINYSEKDSEATWKLYKLYKPRLKQEGLYEVFIRQEMPVANLVFRMERRGVKIDSAFLKKADKEARKDLAETEKNIYRRAGMVFNIASTKQLSEVIFDKLGLQSSVTTPKGKPSTSAAALEEMAGKHPVIDLILKHRKLGKLLSTYIGEDGLRGHMQSDGRIHCNFNTVGAVSGRWSSSDPNLQNISRSIDSVSTYDHVRRAFIPKKGYSMVCGDYEQLELRLLAHFSRDKNLLSAFRQGKDVHAETGKILGFTGEDARQRGKTVNFGTAYGMGPTKLSIEFGVSMEEAKEFLERFYDYYYGVVLWKNDTLGVARRLGYVNMITGRRRRVEGLDSDDKGVRAMAERQCINSVIQGSASDIVECAMIKISRNKEIWNLGYRMLIQVHDELVGEVPEKNAEAAVKLIKAEMENSLSQPLRVDLPVKISSGKNWEEAKG